VSEAAATAGSVTPRGQRRRAAILDAAAERFLAHGFHGTSIDDVGAAAGISGPGVYRHVASKDALLMAVLDRLWTDGFRPAVAAAAERPPREALHALIDAHVALALDERAALVLLTRELRHLPDDYRAAAHRNVQRYIDAWVAPLRALRPDVDDAHARTVAIAVHGCIDSAARTPDAVPEDVRAPVLRAVARGIVDRFVDG
jgi:AcrR family transcriptional regulator